ncbi:class I SAM-dependent methyltransferase family protein [Escherichia coli]
MKSTKIYLNSVGCAGFRQRKTHLQMLIKQAVSRPSPRQRLSAICGSHRQGRWRYVLDALENLGCPMRILLRDYSELNVAQGQKMLSPNGNVWAVCFEQGDAFNREELSALLAAYAGDCLGRYGLLK